MRKLLVLAVLVLASCTARTDGEDMDDADSGITDWSVDLDPQAGTQIQGTANVQTVVVAGFTGTTAASLSIAGAEVGARHPWHVHSGTCATGGPIMGPGNEYPVLMVGSDGRASASADLAIGLDDDGDYHINVHRSPSDLGTIVACGNLRD